MGVCFRFVAYNIYDISLFFIIYNLLVAYIDDERKNDIKLIKMISYITYSSISNF